MQCNEIRNHFADYVAEDLEEPLQHEFFRHLRECSTCQAEFQGLTDLWVKLGSIPAGEPASPDLDVRLRAALQEASATQRKTRSRRPRLQFAAAVVLVVLIGAGIVGSRMWKEQERVAQAVEGSLYRVARETRHALHAGDIIGFGETLHSNGAGAVFALADGSRVEMRAQSEASLEPANDGVRIRLSEGGVIVNAAKQSDGRHLYVQTKDVTVSVVGTVFLVNAEEKGSRVAVIEGEVRVQQGADEKKLRPGEQVATSPLMEPRAVKEEISWSRNAEAHLALLQQSAVSAGAADRAAAEKFEVISIRPRARLPLIGGSRGGGGSAPTGNPCFPIAYTPDSGASLLVLDPVRLRVTRTTLHALIAAAYGVICSLPEGFTGEPEWARSEGYDIEATIPSGSPVYSRDDLFRGAAPKLQKMLQNLLTDRFKLSVRREMKEMPAYNLVVAKTAKWDCQTPPTCRGLRLSENQDPDADSEPGPPYIVPTSFTPHTTISVWTDVATSMTERPVIDRTGLKGFYDIRLEYPDMPAFMPTLEDIRRNLKDRVVGAMQEQLGFKLEPTTARVEVLVIEHVEKPSEN
jgi:uncharacterized protein (TIGR03435 family)